MFTVGLKKFPKKRNEKCEKFHKMNSVSLIIKLNPFIFNCPAKYKNKKTEIINTTNDVFRLHMCV